MCKKERKAWASLIDLVKNYISRFDKPTLIGTEFSSTEEERSSQCRYNNDEAFDNTIYKSCDFIIGSFPEV